MELDTPTEQVVPAVTDKDVVHEPEQLPEATEDPTARDTPPSPKTSDKDRRRHRSSRHSTRSHHSSSKDGPTEELHRPHRKRRESEISTKESPLKAIFGPSSPKSPMKPSRPSRHDSGISTGSTGSHRKHRSERTAEEQFAHDQRKEERRKSKAVDSESPFVGGPADLPSPIFPPVPRRHSSRRYSSTKSTGSKEDAGDRRPKLLDLKGESVVRSPFMVTDKPHIKETTVQPPIIDRPRFSTDGERPKLATERKRSSRHHSQSYSSHRSEKENRDRHKEEEEKEARRVRRERDKQMEIARLEIAENAKRKQELVDEEKRVRREERRKRREAEDKAAGSEKGKERDREHRRPHRDSREKEKPKGGALSSLWYSAKKVFK